MHVVDVYLGLGTHLQALSSLSPFTVFQSFGRCACKLHVSSHPSWNSATGMHCGWSSKALLAIQNRLHSLRVSKRSFRPFAVTSPAVLEPLQESRRTDRQPIRKNLPTLPSTRDAASRRLQLLQADELEKHLTNTKDIGSDQSSEALQSEPSVRRSPTSARRKRRNTNASLPTPARTVNEQRSRKIAAREEASALSQLQIPNAAANVEQQGQRMLSKKEERALCSAIQDSEFIEQQRKAVFLVDSAEQAKQRSSLYDVQAPISGQDYERLRQWKTAVGANTFADLQVRRDRGEKAKTMLLHFNRNLVRHFAWRVKRAGTDVAFGELILAGEEALLKAALKFDARKGAKFTTFAFQRVHRAIVGYMMEHEDVIKIPVHIKELQNKIRRVQPQLTQELGRPPTVAEIARQVERPISIVGLCMRKTQKPHAMDAAPSDSEKDSMVDLIVSAEDAGPGALHSIMHRQFANDIEGVLEMLPHKEGEVLALRYGLFDGEPQSLTDSARYLKMSAEGVRQSELKAFRRLRQAGRLQPLMSYLRETEAHGQGLEVFAA